jgi:carboxyl-terminal processing protease
VGERAAVINEMLSELGTSHTHYYTPLDPEYYQILAIFRGDPDLASKLPGASTYPTLGLLTESIEGQTFVRAVLDGSPGQRAGILAGDRIVSADGAPFQPVQSLYTEGREVRLSVQRRADPRSAVTISVRPERNDGEAQFLLALRDSARVIERGGRRIAYVHVWSWAGEQYQRLLEELLAAAPLADAAGLVLDLREGWGGASADYLHMFHCRPTVESIDREGTRRSRHGTGFRCWDKPVVLLINERTRSGKEIVAYGFRKYGMGKLVGTRTAGAVTAGKAFLLSDGTLLYLARAEVLVDGERLEGVGVAPDVEVPFDIRYSAGSDPQLERAIETLLGELRP